MRNTLLKERAKKQWPWVPIVLLCGVLFLGSSCNSSKLCSASKKKETVLLTPDLHLMAQWNKEVDLNNSFYAKLDSMAAMPSISGAVFRKELDVFQSERLEIRERNSVLVGQIREMPDGANVPGSRPPRPPVPIYPDDQFWAGMRIAVKIPVPVSGWLVINSPKSANEVISIRMGKEEWNSNSTAFKREELAGGIVKFTFNVSTFKPGLGELVIGGANGETPTIVALEFVEK